MTKTSTAKSTCELLTLAQEQAAVVLTIDGRPAIVEMHDPSPPETCREGKLDMDRYLDEANWRTNGPGFRQLQEWVETHWNPEKAKPAPSGMAATGDDSWVQTEVQLDAVTATKKLIAAAKLYGTEPVATIAKHFAAHGMIETHIIWLLNGSRIEVAKSLDDYCTLLPYGEALQKIEAESDPRDRPFEWAEPYADNACALRERYFEHAGPAPSDHRQYASPLLQNGLPELVLLLGLVWGSGFRVLGNWRAVPAVAAATLPYRLTRGPGTARWPAALARKGCGPPPRKRPLAIGELKELAVRYSEHTEQTRCRLRRAMARLRNLAERFEVDDRLTDLGIALHTLFTADDEQDIWDTLIPQRAAWLHADFEDERRGTEAMLARFCRRHVDVLRGRASAIPGSEDYKWSANLLDDTENVLRSCLKTLVSEGWPENWNATTEPSALRLDPPRPESKIPSVKSDALSWSIEEQRAIDQALEEVWKPVVANAPLPPNMSPATVAELSPQLVARYREQRIPYIVTHPARLYLAHPKWPQTGSEPIDERTMYYCERDVAQQTQKWREAAAHKGLVQFEAPTDAGLYHPRHRKDWPQPLLSSHEEESGAGTTNQQTLTGTTEVSRSSIEVADTDQRQRSATDEDPAAPSSELPQPVVAGLEREWSRLWDAFRHDVTVATNSLLYMLEGVHSQYRAERQRLVETAGLNGGDVATLEDAVRTYGDSYAWPTYPRLRAVPTLTGEPLVNRTAPGGAMEQMLWKAWFIDIYSWWESKYRNQLKHENRHLPGAIRPRQQVLGDLGHIRNDLLHNGIAKRNESGRCEILRWFNVGERMDLRLRHVLDFLNQMGWLTESPAVIRYGPGKPSVWRIDRTGEPEDGPAPALVSVRPFVNPQEADTRYRYGASIAFENGVFVTTPMGPEHEETPVRAKDRVHKWMKMTVNDAGNLSVPGLGTASAASLYRSALGRVCIGAP